MLKHEHILALDIGSSGIKLAEFAPQGETGVQLINFAVGSLGLGPGDEADRFQILTMTILEMMQDSGIKPGPVLITVSGQQVFSRFVKLPPVDKDKITQIVAYEAQQNVPFPIEEVVWDYQLIGSGDSELDVMLAAIKGEIIESITAAVENAGMRTDLVDVAPMALYNAARYSGADADGCTLLLDIGARSTDLVFLEEGRVFIRSIPVAGNTITQNIMRELEVSFEEAEDLKLEHAFVGLGGAYDAHEDEVKDRVSKIVRNVMTRMHAEINRSINFYRGQQSGSKPRQLLLAGGSAIIPGTDGFFKEKLKIPVHYFNPFENVPVGAEVDTDAVSEQFNVMGQTVGLALRRILTCPIEINLMPARILADKDMRRRRPVFVLAGMGLVLTLLVWCGFFFKMAQLADERFEIVNRKVASLKRVQGQVTSIQGDLGEVSDKIESLQTLFPARSRWNRILTEIRTHVPRGVWLVSIMPAGLNDFSSMGRGMGLGARGDLGGRDIFGGTGGLEGGLDGTGVAADTAERIEIAGYGYLDKVEDWEPVRDFRDALKASPLFTDETKITWFPPPSEVLREFRIEVVLAEGEDEEEAELTEP